MDKSPALSFAMQQKALPASVYSQNGTGDLMMMSGVNDAPQARSQGVLCCPVCKQQFKEYTAMLLHKQSCSATSATTAAAAQSVPFDSGGGSSNKVVVTSGDRQVQSFVNKFSGHCTRRQQLMLEEFARRKAQLREQRCRKNLRKWDNSRPVHAHWAPKRKRVASPDPPPSQRMSEEEFLKGLGLVTNSKAVKIKHEAESHGEVDLDCQIIAVEGPIAGEPLHSPRTTRSLMSQLSRESAEAARKRLSFCLDNEDASESEVFDRRAAQGSLLSIDFASPLGQRLKNHMKGDLVVPPLTGIELYCSEPVQDAMAAKLRYRVPDYPIMHRKRKGIVTGYCHTFKFNNVERREFIKTLRTGLNARSRRLLLLTKKCMLKLTRLRVEEIRHWTMRRRTIVNQEIAIDDDISIVQVDVPEHMFNAVQKMPVPSDYRLQFRQNSNYKPARYGGQSGSAYQLSGHPDMPYPYPTSCFTAHQAPMPQFLVKQVSKNWTENGKESQKLVFVPIEETPPMVPGSSHLSRGLSHSSGQRHSKPSSSGIQRSLPRHLRPCPKSKRKQQLPEQDSFDDFTIETASSSSDEEHEKRLAQKEMVYPLSMSRADSGGVPTPWMMPEKPVPQMLHRAADFSSSAVTSEPVHFPGRTAPKSLLMQQLESRPGAQLGQSDTYVASHSQHGSASAAADRERSAAMRKQLSMFNLTPAGRNAGAVKTEDGAHGAKTGISIGAVYSASDLSNEQLAASLGLECTSASSSTSRLQRLPQQPNFLHSDSHSEPTGVNPAPQPSQPPPQTQSHISHNSVRHSSQHSASPKPVFSRSLLSHSGHHQPSILRNPGNLQSSAATKEEASPSAASVCKRPPAQARSFKDWTVVRASDDDVVEVICIDDDD
ncbi:hypothetical protein V1264_021118 [Littorina saxatilis]|uniref:Uncharacterized protein n=2 Tax=Littorina saxatilis TaxID=31220 RepID=A0AAN9BCK3_9CAEN